ncbi:hypothetical protein D3C71_1498080 [compost metagenome]
MVDTLSFFSCTPVVRLAKFRPMLSNASPVAGVPLLALIWSPRLPVSAQWCIRLMSLALPVLKVER